MWAGIILYQSDYGRHILVSVLKKVNTGQKLSYFTAQKKKPFVPNWKKTGKDNFR